MYALTAAATIQFRQQSCGEWVLFAKMLNKTRIFPYECGNFVVTHQINIGHFTIYYHYYYNLRTACTGEYAVCGRADRRMRLTLLVSIIIGRVVSGVVGNNSQSFAVVIVIHSPCTHAIQNDQRSFLWYCCCCCWCWYCFWLAVVAKWHWWQAIGRGNFHDATKWRWIGEDKLRCGRSIFTTLFSSVFDFFHRIASRPSEANVFYCYRLSIERHSSKLHK